MNIYLDLFLTFAKVGVCTFGGGYAMLPILQREIVEKRAWATEEELADYFAIGQCTPGIIAVNTATFVGYKYKKHLGGLFSTLGVVFPSVVIITIIAAFLSSFTHFPVVQHALSGVNACVVALIANSALKLGHSTLKTAAARWIFLVTLGLALLGQLVTPESFSVAGPLLDAILSPAPLIASAGIAGYFLFFPRSGKGGDRS